MAIKKRLKEDNSSLDSKETKGVGLPKGKEGSYDEPKKKSASELDSEKTKGVGIKVEEDELNFIDDEDKLSEEDEEFMDLFKESFGSEDEEMVSEEDDLEKLLDEESEDEEMVSEEDEEEKLSEEDEMDLEKLEEEDEEEFVGSEDEEMVSEEDEENKEVVSESDELEELLDESDEMDLENLEEEDEPFVLDSEEEKLSEEDELSDEEKKLVAEEDEEEAKEIQEHVNAMFKGEKINLNEAFKNKVQTIFEAAIKAKTKKERKLLEAKANKKLNVIKENMYKKYGTKVNQYMNYVVEEWKKENKLAIESSFRSRVTESFIKDLRKVFLKHDIDVPKSKQNLVHKIGKKLEEKNRQLNAQVAKNLSQSTRIKMLEKRIILAKECENLSSLQSDKLKKLAEGVSYENPQAFSKKLKLLKQNYFNKVAKKPIIEDVADNATQSNARNSVMSKYVSAARKIS